jgi:hypothetical protein
VFDLWWYCVLSRHLSSHLAIIVLTLNKVFVAISLSFHRITYSPPSRCSQTRFPVQSLDYPFLPDVPPNLLKCSCSLVEPGLHLANLLELCVLTPRRDWDHN